MTTCLIRGAAPRQKPINQIRQGDVLLCRVAAPAVARLVADAQGLRVEGERTGHAHVLRSPVYDTPAGRLLWVRDDGATITHDEHAAIRVPAGWWQPVLQREYAPRRNFSRSRRD